MDALLVQLAVLDAQVAIVQMQVAGLRAACEAMAKQTTPTVTVALPERCQGMRPAHCALQEPDARINRATLSDPNAWQCAGCRHQESMTHVVES